MKNQTTGKTNLAAFFALCALTACGCGDQSAAGGSIEIGGSCDATDQCVENAECRSGVCVDKTSCEGVVCNDGETCSGGECKPNGGDQCGSVACKDGETCVDGECKPAGGDCGGVLCNDGETCVEGKCKPAADPDPEPQEKCGTAVCNEGEVCFQKTCRTAGDCGGVLCNDGETCDNGTCRSPGDCNGLACYSSETCFFGTCKPKGDCWGIACADDEVCFDSLCRKKGDCGGVQCDEVAEYCYDGRCREKMPCGDVYCDAEYVCTEQGTCALSEYCLDGSPRCGADCCEGAQFCGSRKTCCDPDNSCGNDCCQTGEACEYETCQKDCGQNARCRLTDGTAVCCGEGEICTSEQCYLPSVSCVDNYMCENGEYCDGVTKTCLPKPTGEACFMKPTGGEVQPTLLWYWGETAPAQFPDHVQVMSAPMVADMNSDTIPDVVFNSFSGAKYNGNGIIRIVNGKTGELIASSDGKDADGNSFMTDGGSQVALGDLDGDTIPEIVTCSEKYKLAVYKFDPASNAISLLWKSANTINECGQGGPGIADFDGDGRPEVYARYNVHDGMTGELLGSQSCFDVGGSKLDSLIQHAPCDYSVAADIDGDGDLELVGGNVAYKLDKTNKKLVEVFNRRADGHADGYPAVADIDLDGNPEIFVVRSYNTTPSVMVFNNDGTNHWNAPVAHSVYGGGAPTVANVTGDAHPEMTFAGRDGYVVFDYLGNVVWSRSTNDKSSAKTGSSVFDFDGDGKAEIVYADEYYLRVYNGDDGNTVYCKCNTSGTHWEYPVIVDVNNDGHAEIVVSSNNSMIKSCPSSLSQSQGLDACVQAIMNEGGDALKGTHGVRVFSSPNQDWVATRKIYNQHAYSITNVSDNGAIPSKHRNNWSIDGLNNFRLNVQPGANYLPNLKITSVSNPYQCEADGNAKIYFVIENNGWATAKAGITVKIYKSDTPDGEYTLLGSVKTDDHIAASQQKQMAFELPDGEKLANGMYIHLSLGDDAPAQCKDDGHSATYAPTCQTVIN